MSTPRVEQYMTRMPHTIAATEPLRRARELMQKYRIRHLPVVEGDTLIGIISLTDLLLIRTLTGVDMDVPVAHAMTEQPVIVTPDTPLDEVAARMAHERIGSVLIVVDGNLEGIFTNIDALKALLHLWKQAP